MKPLRFSSQKQSARSLALQVLLETSENNAFAQDLLDRHLNQCALSPQDRRLTTHLVYGVIRRRGTLDVLLKHAVTRPRREVESWLWESLRLGVYQMAFLAQIPAHAAIFETVELAQFVGRPQAKGFLNGVLRKISSFLTEENDDQPSRNRLPVEKGQYRVLTADLLPDLKTAPINYLSAAMSWPMWLAKRWFENYGWDECLRLGFWFLETPALFLRCNRLKGNREELMKRFAETNISASPLDYDWGVRLDDAIPIPKLPGYDSGWFTVQDPSSMRVAEALPVESGMRVLDLCAAPGGKTTHLAERMNNTGEILAVDVEASRLKIIDDLAARLGISIIKTLNLDSRQSELPDVGQFDAALVDVPCSNTGVLARRPEVRWRLSVNDIKNLVPLQKRLLQTACERVRPGGIVLYSTCSIEPEENQGVVDAVLRNMPIMSKEAEDHAIPGKPADGGYWARLRKSPN